MDRRRLLLIFSCLVLFCCVGTLAFVFIDIANRAPMPRLRGEAPLPPPEVLLRLMGQANVAIGQLENGQPLEADPTFRGLTDQLPREVLGPRNLAISRLLAYEQGTASRDEFEQVLEWLFRIDSESAIPEWLSAQACLHAMREASNPQSRALELEQAFLALRKAAGLEPNNLVYQFAIYEATMSSSDEEHQTEGHRALQVAYRLAPQNLAVLSEYLLAQAEQRDPEILSTLATAQVTLAALQRPVRAASGTDLQQYLEATILAVKEAAWPTVRKNLRHLFKDLIGEHAFSQNDRQALFPLPVTFLMHRFDEPLRTRMMATPEWRASHLVVDFIPFSDEPVLPGDDIIVLRLVDFDLDGRLDLLVLRDQRLEVLGHATSGWQQIAAVDLPAGSRGLVAADLDCDRTPPTDRNLASRNCFDADLDVIVFGSGGITILRNELDRATGRRRLVPIPQTAILPPQQVNAAVLLDMDQDGNLDLVVAAEQGIRILLCEGNASFVDVTEFSELPTFTQAVTHMVAVDWDRDSCIDIVLTAPSEKVVGYLKNLRHGNFAWCAFDESFVAIAGSHALAVLDLDQNGSWDVCGAGPLGTNVAYTVRASNGTIQQASSQAAAPLGREGLLSWDFNNDGYEDVLAWGEGTVSAFRGDVNGSVQSVDYLFSSLPTDIRSCDFGDLDADGDLDLVLLTQQGLRIFSNEGANQNHWLQLRVVGLNDPHKTNHHSLGCVVELRSGSQIQTKIVDRPVTHFGLGNVEQADVLRIVSGYRVHQAVIQPSGNRSICETLVLSGPRAE